jgi:phosphoribosyl 1,2-cyclic phosphodiesterase
VHVDTGGEVPLILDAGTGLRSLGAVLAHRQRESGRPIHAHLLLTHLHYDHLLGLPFFGPLEDPGALVEVFGPRQGDVPLAEVVGSAVTPPFFPVQMKEFRGEVRLRDLGDEDLEFGDVVVRARSIPHTDTTLGFRIEHAGAAIAYLPDHQAPLDRTTIAPGVLELCDGVDLLLHDAQYDDNEFAAKSDWGHSTIAYAVHVAATAGARRLGLFHHDPSHDDVQLNRLEEGAQRLPGAERLDEVFAARESTGRVVGASVR